MGGLRFGLRVRAFLVLAEGDANERAFEFPARVEAGHDAIDLAGADFFSSGRAFDVGTQPEAAKIAEFDDVAFGQFIRDDGQQAFDSSDHIGCGERGHLRSAFGKLAGADAAAGLDGRVELFGGFLIGRVAFFNDICFPVDLLSDLPYFFLAQLNSLTNTINICPL